MDCVGSGKEGGVSLEETVPLLEYMRLSQSAWLPDDMDPLKSDANGEPAADADGDAEAVGSGAEGIEASQGAPVRAAVAATKANSVEADRKLYSNYSEFRMEAGACFRGGYCNIA
ncbi:hypothetical protein OsI_11327 [Oryza sativa Indica Group]|uniref:Uncharacterized protein n=1 Tax=Oryza sativa subsp. indica TaxID=39946 RepID=B8AN08_ORYSI|nr:hypothetical protein OsI_11327 [Oryza sativa Indica Group]